MNGSELTYGNARARLIQNGYWPVSALRPDLHGYRSADDPVAICCISPSDRSLNVVALTATARDSALRAAILAVLEQRGLAKGPVRVDSAGNETRVWQYSEYSPVFRRHTSEPLATGEDPAVCLDSCERLDPRLPAVSGIIRVAGEWRNGSPWTVRREKLPKIDNDAIELLFNELSGVFPRETWVSPPYVPQDLSQSLRELNCPKFVGPKSWRELAGNPAAIEARLESIRNGRSADLPMENPEEKVAPAQQRSLADRVFRR